MAETTLITETPDASSDHSNSKRYSDSAVREAYRMLLEEFHDSDKTVTLVARSCRLSADEIRRILSVPPASASAPASNKVKELKPNPVVLAPASQQDMSTRILKAPKPGAMLAFKQFALRDKSVNATILAAVQLPGENREPAHAALESNGFKALPAYAQLNESQQAILDYVAMVFETHPARLCCGAKNVLVEGAEEKVGHISSPGLPVDEAHFDALVVPVRQVLSKTLPKASVHYVSLPPLDLSKLQHSPHTLILERAAEPSTAAPREFWVDEKFLRSRSRDMVFVKWVAERFPKGAPLDEVAAHVECSDWLIALLAYTRFPPDTLEGKRMLVRLGCFCAVRAQRWSPSQHARHALASAERWEEEPTEEHRALAEKAHAEVSSAAQAGEKPPPEGAEAYTAQAALESASRAVQAAYSTEPSRVRSNATRAAAAAVMAASFAANAAKTTSWLEMVSSRAVPDETEEHRALCIAIRAILHRQDG